MRILIRSSILATLSTVVGLAAVASAQMAVYPSKGQSAAQQNKDKAECHAWAVQQGGYDPLSAPQPQAAPPPQQGQVLRGAAGGAAIGAIGGAIAGDAGKGAAIGAAAGGGIGAIRKNRDAQASQQAQQQQAQAQQQQRATYDKFVASCLTGRGYSVTQ